MPKIEIDYTYCKGCELCFASCPKQLLSRGEDTTIFGTFFPVYQDNGQCIGCKMCAITCPDAAITVYK